MSCSHLKIEMKNIDGVMEQSSSDPVVVDRDEQTTTLPVTPQRPACSGCCHLQRMHMQNQVDIQTPQVADYADLIGLDIRVGTVTAAALNAKARKPMYVLDINFGADLGILRTSAQITANYPDPQQLVGTQVVAATNLPVKLIAGIKSQVLLLAATDPSGSILLSPRTPTENGVSVR